jgi:hypothetical protein
VCVCARALASVCFRERESLCEEGKHCPNARVLERWSCIVPTNLELPFLQDEEADFFLVCGPKHRRQLLILCQDTLRHICEHRSRLQHLVQVCLAAAQHSAPPAPPYTVSNYMPVLTALLTGRAHFETTTTWTRGEEGRGCAVAGVRTGHCASLRLCSCSTRLRSGCRLSCIARPQRWSVAFGLSCGWARKGVKKRGCSADEALARQLSARKPITGPTFRNAMVRLDAWGQHSWRFVKEVARRVVNREIGAGERTHGLKNCARHGEALLPWQGRRRCCMFLVLYILLSLALCGR